MKLNAFLVFCTSLWIAGAAGAQQEPAAARAVDPTLVPYAHRSDAIPLPDGRSIHMVCMGRGSPVVVLTAGAGDPEGGAEHEKRIELHAVPAS